MPTASGTCASIPDLKSALAERASTSREDAR
jgi:hypothetical protein